MDARESTKAIDKHLRDYLKALEDLTRRGDATEESYYPALEAFLRALAQALGHTVQVTVLPKGTEAGNPDFRVWDGSYQVIGYIEAKAPGTNLEAVEGSEQLRRYLQTFPNLILTDFYEFRLYRQGVLLERALLPRPLLAKAPRVKLPAQKVKPSIGGAQVLEGLFRDFFSFTLPPSLTPEVLSVELARRTRFLRDQILLPELKEGKGPLQGFYEAFQQYLIAGLTREQFADLYAQTLTYGLFAARTRTQGPFNRLLAYSLIPSTVGILRDIFQFISLGKPSSQMQVMVDEIAAVLNAADVKAILEEYYRQGKGDDPILYFYETFLAEYDPEIRERRGVYYTPKPVVRYIVRAVHEVLKTRFGLSDGLASPEVTLLDPAAGTLTFPAEAIRLAFEESDAKYGEGNRSRLLREHILPHFYAFELLVAPYAIGHLKISFLLEALGVPLREGERFRLYLTNTLEMENLLQTPIPGLASLSEESQEAAKVKNYEPILVVLGNPPYSGSSANLNDWTEQLLKEDLDGAQSYYKVDGSSLGERNPKWLQDDYVKFLRFAQWKIHRTGRGVVAMITNHGYLDNPTFRGMRQSLLKTFDEIYLLDLHGNAKKRETAPDGRKDENVFDIQQGVAIGIFIKHGDPERRGVYHADLYGLREEKYRWLEEHTLETAGYRPIAPQSPYYFFVPRAAQIGEAYLFWPRIKEIFPIHSVGIVTGRDAFAIAFEEADLRNRILQFQNVQGLSDEVLAQDYGLKDKPGWSLEEARRHVQEDPNPQAKIHPILYRPFDVRYVFYHNAVIERPRRKVMRHMLAGENLALIVPRQHKGDFGVFVTAHIAGHKAVAAFDINYLFPLYPSPGALETERRPNLAEWLLLQLTAAYGFFPTPEEVLAYIYAVFYSPTYRRKYAQKLQIDFPRVPFTRDAGLFREMAALGQRLIDLHLLKSPDLDPPLVKYRGVGEDRIEAVRYSPEEGRVYINQDKYFEGITPKMWEYRIGGYQVLEKYLKDRKGRLLEDPVRYLRIATAIARTMEVQAQIDQIYPKVEGDVLQIEVMGLAKGRRRKRTKKPAL